MAINAEAMKVKLISATNEWFFPNSESCWMPIVATGLGCLKTLPLQLQSLVFLSFPFQMIVSSFSKRIVRSTEGWSISSTQWFSFLKKRLNQIVSYLPFGGGLSSSRNWFSSSSPGVNCTGDFRWPLSKPHSRTCQYRARMRTNILLDLASLSWSRFNQPLTIIMAEETSSQLAKKGEEADHYSE